MKKHDTYIGADNVIQKKNDYLFPCSHHFYKDPPQIVKGKMQYLFDSDGKKYLDFFAGVSVMNCGHSNDVILESTIAQMRELQHTTTIYLTEPIVNLAEKLASVLPGDIRRSFFCCTGSEANEGALLLAKLHTNKDEFISLRNGLHGRTYLTMSATGIDMWRSDPNLSGDVHIARSIASYFEENTALEYMDKNILAAANESLKSIEDIIISRGSNKIAALIIEPIQGNGGMITPPGYYIKALSSLLKFHGILLIVDEVQTGFGRTGKMFAIDNYFVVPDIITVAKALGNGMPISAFCTTDEIASSFTKPSASTLGGNPVSSATAMAVIDYINDHKLADNANTLGNYLISNLNSFKKKFPCIIDVRGYGLMVGAEIRNDDMSPSPEKVDAILENLKNRGILLGKNGINRNVLAFQPPLVITKDDVDFLLLNLEEVLEELK